MARVIIVFDPDGRLGPVPEDEAHATRIKQAMLDLPDDLADRDIYEIARKLAELLLEQL